MIDLSLMVQALEDVVFLIDENLVFQQYWVARKEILWMSPEAFLDKTIGEVFPNGLGTVNLEEKTKQVFVSGGNEKFIYQMSTVEEEERWFRGKLHLTNRRDETGKRLLLLIIGDCTDEVTIKKREPLFKSLIDQNWEAIRFIDLELTIRYVNQATNRLYGYDEGELVGRKVNQITQDANIDIKGVSATVMETGQLGRRSLASAQRPAPFFIVLICSINSRFGRANQWVL